MKTFALKIGILSISLIISFASLFSQNFTAPESVIYYPKGDFFLASNAGNGSITKFTSLDDKTTYISGLSGPKGMCIVGDTLYAADVSQLAGIDLTTGTKLFSNSIPTSQFLNDICTDGKGFLYITDMQMNKIWKYNISNGETTYLSLSNTIASPNGIIYYNEKLLVVTFTSPGNIYEVDPVTNVSTLIKSDSYAYLDGIQSDGKGNIYISAWNSTSQSEAGAIYKIKDDFSGDFELVKDKLSGPADFLYKDGALYVPEMNANKITIIDFTSVKDEKKIEFSINGKLIIPSDIIPPYLVQIYDVIGNKVFDKQTELNKINIELPPGVYFVRVNNRIFSPILVCR